MRHQEKKYRIDSFTSILKILIEKHAKKESEIVTTHYYTPQKTNDVVKLVISTDRNEIHMLTESQGKYSFTEKIPVKSTKTGLQWLKDKGYKTVHIVKMAHTDYEYKNGIVGLYIIDDFLHSVILDFPEGQHDTIEKELRLNMAEVISIPYNKLLIQLGHQRLMDLK